MSKPFAVSLLVMTLSAGPGLAFGSGNHTGAHGAEDDIGKPGKVTKSTKTIAIDMNDAMRFAPAKINVNRGETIRFVVTNSGKLKHEMALGTEKEIKEHYEAMKKFPGMEHEDPKMVTVPSGKTSQVVWTFTKAGKVEFACLQPGHYESGMKGSIGITAEETRSAGKNPS